jgi:hypothetical protein
MVGSVLKPEDQIQNAELSWRDARRIYEALPDRADTRARKDALYKWNDAAKDYFSRVFAAAAGIRVSPRTVRK